MLEKGKLLSGEGEKMVIIKGSREAVSARLRVHVELEVRTKSFAGLQCRKMEGNSSNKLQRIAQNVVFFSNVHNPVQNTVEFILINNLSMTTGFPQKNKGGRQQITELPEWCLLLIMLWKCLDIHNDIFFFLILSLNKQTVWMVCTLTSTICRLRQWRQRKPCIQNVFKWMHQVQRSEISAKHYSHTVKRMRCSDFVTTSQHFVTTYNAEPH